MFVVFVVFVVTDVSRASAAVKVECRFFTYLVGCIMFESFSRAQRFVGACEFVVSNEC